MKKTFKYIAFAVAALAFAACAEELDNKQTAAASSGEENLTVMASADAVDTKINFTDDNDAQKVVVSWNESGEAFTGFIDGTAVQFGQKAAPSENGYATFKGSYEGELAAEKMLYAIYPKSESTDVTKVALDLTKQSGLGRDQNSAYMYGSANFAAVLTSGLIFNHLTSVLKFTLSFTDADGNAVTSGKLTDVVIKASDLAKTATVDLTQETPAVTPSKGDITLSGEFDIVDGKAVVYCHTLPATLSNLNIRGAVDGKPYLAIVGGRTGGKAMESGRQYGITAAMTEQWVVETIAGSGTNGSSFNEDPMKCQFGLVTGLAFVPDSNETEIWITQRKGGLVRKLTLGDSHRIEEVASSVYVDANENNVTDVNIWQGAFNSKGEYYVAQKAKSVILKYNPSTKAFDLWKSTATGPMNIAFDKNDNLFVACRDAQKILKFDSEGNMTEYPLEFRPNYIAFDLNGNIISGTQSTNALNTWRIYQISPDFETKTIIAGSGVKPTGLVNGTPGNPLTATIGNCDGLKVGSDGCIYFTEVFGSHSLRKLTPDSDGKYENGTITTIAGQTVSGNVNGLGWEAKFNAPEEILITDDCKTIYICCSNSSVIKKISRQ